jgi:hypothetical protein
MQFSVGWQTCAEALYVHWVITGLKEFRKVSIIDGVGHASACVETNDPYFDTGDCSDFCRNAAHIQQTSPGSNAKFTNSD